MENGFVFVLGDFEGIADIKSISKTLNRMCEEGAAQKLMRGVFRKPVPDGSDPSPDEIARALARENSWHLVPCGETALHIMGLTENEPAVWTYVSDGTYRSYNFGKHRISFTHTTAKTFRSMSDRTALLVQVIKAYGNIHLPDDLMKKIAGYFKPSEIAKICRECHLAPVWVESKIKRMFPIQNKKRATF